MIYFIQEESNRYIKFGYAKNNHSINCHLKIIQKQLPTLTLKIIGRKWASQQEVKIIHQIFSTSKIENDKWYAPDNPLVEFINGNTSVKQLINKNIDMVLKEDKAQITMCTECHERPVANKKRGLCSKCYAKSYRKNFNDNPKIINGSFPIILQECVIISKREYKELLHYRSKINPKEYTVPYSKKKVYFIRNEEGYIKIGQSINPHKRLKQLQTSYPGELKILATAYGKDNFEGVLHKALRKNKISGEWYRLDKNFINIIKQFGIDIKIE